MNSGNWIYDYIYDLVKIKFITNEEALYYANGFHNKGKLSDAEYKSLILLIEMTYQEQLCKNNEYYTHQLFNI